MTARIEKSLVATLGCLAAFIIGNNLHLQDVYWSIITIIVLVTDYPEALMSKSFLRIVGTITGALIGLVAASVTADNAILFILSIFLFAAIGCYQVHRSRHPYAWLLGGATCFMVQIACVANHQLSFNIAIWRSTEIILGTMIVLIIESLWQRCNLEDDFCQHLNSNYRSIAVYIDRIINSLQEPPKPSLNELQTLAQTITHCRKSLSLLETRKRLPPLIDHYRDSFNSLTTLYHYLQYFFQENAEQDNSVLNQTTLTPLLKKIRDHYRHFDIHQQPSLDTLKQLLAHYQKSLDNYRQTNQIKQYPVTMASKQYQWLNLSRFLIDMLSHQQRLPQHPMSTMNILAENHTLTIKQSIKVGLSCVVTFYLWIISGWYGGLVGVVSSYIISSQEHLVVSNWKALTRFVGCLVGSLCGVIAVSFLTHSLVTMLLSLACGIFISSYFIHGNERYSYLALQAGVAFAIATVTPNGMIATSITPSLLRLAGIYLGLISSLLITNLLWPSHPRLWLSDNLKKNQNKLIDLLRAFAHKNKCEMHLLLTDIKRRHLYNKSLAKQCHNDDAMPLQQQDSLIHVCALLSDNNNQDFYSLATHFHLPLNDIIEHLIAKLVRSSSKPLNMMDYLKNIRKNADTTLIDIEKMAVFIQVITYLDLLVSLASAST